MAKRSVVKEEAAKPVLVQFNLKLDGPTVARIDEELKRLNANIRGADLKRNDVARILIMRGLDAETVA